MQLATITGPDKQEWARAAAALTKKGHEYRTNPAVYEPIDALLDAAFESKDDPARDIALDFWLYGFVHLAPRTELDDQGRSVYIFDPGRSRIETVKADGKTYEQLCATEFTFNAGMGSRISFGPGAYIRLELDREKCIELPSVDADGGLGPEAVPWLEEWVRASEELTAFVRQAAR